MGSSHDCWEDALERTKKVASEVRKEQWEKDLEKNDGEWPTEERINAIGQNGNNGEHYNKYQVRLRNNIAIDVYDVLDAFKVDNPATAHAIKKLLMAGKRGYKDFNQDLDEAIASIQRAKDFPSIPF